MRPPDLAPGEALALTRRLNVCPDPLDLYAAVSAGGRTPGTVLLETAEVPDGERKRGGRSLVVARSALSITARSRLVTVRALNENGAALLPWIDRRVTAAETVYRGEDALTWLFAERHPSAETARLKAPSPLDVARVLLGLEETSRQQVPLLVGGLAYDLLEWFERLPPAESDPLSWPDLELWLPDRLVWLDHERQGATVAAFLYGGGDAARAYGEAAASIVELADIAARPTASSQSSDRREPPPEELVPTVDLDDDAYADLVRNLKTNIVAGDLFQIVPSRCYTVPCPDPLAAYRELRGLNPSPYMYYLASSHGVLLGSSPETAVRVDGDSRRVHIRPIAGTRPRGWVRDRDRLVLDPDLDSRLEAELRLDEKELAEHMMLVDVARNDVARVSEPGTRTVERLLQVERYSHVMHLVSHVSGTLRADLDPLHAYVATMNMGTLTGAPKVRAAELLRRHEATRRGPYGGAVGYVTADGNLDSAIVIRSAVVQLGMAHVRAGAGVVYDSNPDAEARETRGKAQAVVEAIRRASAACRPDKERQCR
jgi:anthranilate synthase component 1